MSTIHIYIYYTYKWRDTYAHTHLTNSIFAAVLCAECWQLKVLTAVLTLDDLGATRALCDFGWRVFVPEKFRRIMEGFCWVWTSSESHHSHCWLIVSLCWIDYFLIPPAISPGTARWPQCLGQGDVHEHSATGIFFGFAHFGLGLWGRLFSELWLMRGWWLLNNGSHEKSMRNLC